MTKHSLTPIERFLTRVEIAPNGCWEWKTPSSKRCYGTFHLKDKSIKAHRFSYQYFVGSIPEGLTLDHLCRNLSCVNPDHLELASKRTNILRGMGIPAKNARATHCPKGHPYDLFNTYNLLDDRDRNARFCKLCHREANKRYRRRLSSTIAVVEGER
jgi:hypothetical protein